MSEQKPSDKEMYRMLVQLHDELERAQPLDENERAMLRHLLGDIQGMLAQSGGKTSLGSRPNQRFLDGLRKAIDTFEVSNPTLTMIIEKTLDTLSIAGI